MQRTAHSIGAESAARSDQRRPVLFTTAGRRVRCCRDRGRIPQGTVRVPIRPLWAFAPRSERHKSAVSPPCLPPGSRFIAACRIVSQAREARGIGRARRISARSARETTQKQKPAEAAGSAFPTGGREKSIVWRQRAFPTPANFASALLATGKVCPTHAAPGGLLQQLKGGLYACIHHLPVDPLTGAVGRRASGAPLYHRGSPLRPPERAQARPPPASMTAPAPAPPRRSWWPWAR